MQDYSVQLSKYMPEAAAPIISKWINETSCSFRISRSRSSKLGDYTAPFQGKGHRISINHNLNRFAFLVTTVHEFAHLKTYVKFKNTVKPHGNEWKQAFQELMNPFFDLGVFPADVRHAIKQYLNNPAASSCTDLNLHRTLKNYDKQSENVKTVEEIDINTYFSLKNGRVFQKKEKIRKRYRCVELKTKRVYLFSPIAEVFVISA